jgi:hypothetical protein
VIILGAGILALKSLRGADVGHAAATPEGDEPLASEAT